MRVHLLLLLGNLDAHVLLDNKARDSLVAERRVDGRKDKEEFGLVRVGDPPVSPSSARALAHRWLTDAHLGSVDHPIVAPLGRRRLERERVRSARGLREGEAAELVLRELREVGVLDVLGGVVAEYGVDERVVDVAKD